jgi:hypothetical protein
MEKTRFLVISGMILAAAASRFIPHPPNFSPITAMALLGGACFVDKRWAFAVPLAALLVSDVLLGFHRLIPFVYGSFALIVCLGFWLRTRRTAVPIAGVALASSLLFFTVTNFGVWALGNMYPKTTEGLLACYVAAIPFFWNTVLGDAAYTMVLFGGLALAEKGPGSKILHAFASSHPVLRAATPATFGVKTTSAATAAANLLHGQQSSTYRSGAGQNLTFPSAPAEAILRPSGVNVTPTAAPDRL